jgi:SGNH hydrolase-like domain, acetyltransferase AlgX
MYDVPEMFSAWQRDTVTPRLTATTRIEWLFLGIFALCLVAPLIQTLHPFFGNVVAPLEERRRPNPFPSLRLLFGTGGDFAATLNKWFDDRVGFRDLFIRTKNQIDYTLFHTSKKVWLGSDGWLFARGEPLSTPDLDAAALAKLEETFLTLARRLHDKGVQLIVIGYPDKSTIYPEMAPPDMPRWPTGGNYDRLRQFLSGRSDLKFIDAAAIIKREKSNSPEHLFYKTDMHATIIADIPIVKEIVARIARAEGRTDIRWDEHFKFSHAQWNYGSDGRFLSLLTPPKEEIAVLDGIYAVGGTEPDGHWFLPDPHVLERADEGVGRPFDWEFRSLPELCPQRLPAMVLFGNSFSDLYWALGLHRYFCSIRRAREPISRFQAFYETMPADTKYFIYQYWDPQLRGILDLLKQISEK